MGLRIPSKVKAVVMTVLVAAVFGAAGYMIVPQSAKSALSEADRNLLSVRNQLKQSLDGQKKLGAELKQVTQSLTQAEARVEELTEAEESARAKVDEVELAMAAVETQLTQAKDANASLSAKAEQAQKEAVESKARAEQADSRAGEVQQELAAVTQQRDRLNAEHGRLAGEKAKLAEALSGQKQASAWLYDLLGVLELGPMDSVPPAPNAPAERPVTVKELVWCLDHPSLVLQKGQELSMYWGEEHTAKAVHGIVTMIDGEPATRAVLAKVADVPPWDAPPAGQWRLPQGQPLHYVELVAMFGRPDGTAGTGRDFTAWWCVGAWGRTATAKVVDGVVKEFDGRAADPAGVCELVRQRSQAYRQPGQEAAEDARKYYERAAWVVGEDLKREAAFQARDGWNLKQWSLAPFDSVGCWMAPVDPVGGAMTLRAVVRCTWVNDNGSVRRDQRYVVVTLTPGPDGLEQTEYAIFQPRG